MNYFILLFYVSVDDKQENNKKADCKRHHRGSQSNENKTKTFSGDSSKQKLVVMSYSRYCRYRAQLQRRREGQFSGDCTISKDDTKKVAITYQGVDTKTTTRVLFCRDTYDYPAELLLEPFNAQQGHNQNANVLVNHMGKYIGHSCDIFLHSLLRFLKVLKEYLHLIVGYFKRLVRALVITINLL